MEIKINKEILTYQETIFFGLTMRQFFCSALAVGTALGLYALLSRFMGRESVSWICILGAAPFAVAGFFQYNGMTLERFFMAYIRSEFFMPKRLLFRSNDLYVQLMEHSSIKEAIRLD